MAEITLTFTGSAHAVLNQMREFLGAGSPLAASMTNTPQHIEPIATYTATYHDAAPQAQNIEAPDIFPASDNVGAGSREAPEKRRGRPRKPVPEAPVEMEPPPESQAGNETEAPTVPPVEAAIEAARKLMNARGLDAVKELIAAHEGKVSVRTVPDEKRAAFIAAAEAAL